MSERARLLVVDDDPRVREALSLYLEDCGFDVCSARDGREALQKAFSDRPHLVLLDVMMPEMDGWQTCQRLREVTDVPIIMLTALGQEADKIKGLDIGADDYVVKPFSLHEVAARVRAALRRSGFAGVGAESVLFADDRLVVDADGWEVRCDGQALDLTATERRLLFLLAENAGRILTTETILDRVWGPEYVSQTDYVKLYVWRIRKKIEPAPQEPRYILTEHGVGYKFAEGC